MKVRECAVRKRACEILEASLIMRCGPDKFVSKPSVYLCKKEIEFLG